MLLFLCRFFLVESVDLEDNGDWDKMDQDISCDVVEYGIAESI